MKSYEEEEDSSAKKSRGNRFFPDNVVEVLNKWFFDNQDYPYPDEQTTNWLAKEASISPKQVRKWFANKRVRSNKCYKQTFRSKPSPQKAAPRRTKSTSELPDEGFDSASPQLSVSPSFHDSFYENFLRTQQFIQTALLNTHVIANLLHTTPPTSSCSGIIKRKTHLSNRFLNEQMQSENETKCEHTDTSVQAAPRKPRVNFGLISDLI
jgi:hypothetical protein